MKYDIWHDAEEKLHALYGAEMPLPVMARYQREKKRMQNTDITYISSSTLVVEFLCSTKY